ADDFGLATVVLRSTGAAIFNQSQGSAGLSATHTFFVPLPATAVAGSTVQFFTDVTDTASQTATFGPFVVTVDADTVAPTLSNPTPADGSSFASTKSITVGVTAADNVGIQSVDIIVDGAVTTKTSGPYQITYVAKTVSAPTPVPIRFVAHDYAGNTAEIDE